MAGLYSPGPRLNKTQQALETLGLPEALRRLGALGLEP